MKKGILGALLACIVSVSTAQNSRNYAVELTATLDATEPSITINIVPDAIANSYEIYRTTKEGSSWGTAVANLTGADESWTDTDIELNKEYQYRVIKRGSAGFIGSGYLMTSIEAPVVHKRGGLILLVENDLYTSISSDIDEYAQDIASDGWTVEIEVVTADKDHEAVKQIIANSTVEDKKAVLILGHVAVPYSGVYCEDPTYTVPPDGHGPGQGDHCGAWAADVYYGIPTATWTDNDTVVATARREANKNRKDDKKYDQITLPGEVTLQVGRVDLSNLPEFSETESELVQRYISKARDYRFNKGTYYAQGVIDENFPASYGAFASTAWRCMPSLLGLGTYEEKDFLTTLKDSTYLFGYGTGAGSYTSCRNVATTKELTTNNSAVFNLLFGSYFGDWDNKNNILRAVLATEKGGLTNSWVGRPWWQMHHMGLGETVGYSTKVTQNNSNFYTSTFFSHNVHVALMGDPTLRLYMFDGVTDLTANKASDGSKVDLSWTASKANGVLGYHVYQSYSPTGPFVKASHDRIEGTNFSHNAPFDGDVYYMVRAERLETTPSGSFYNLSAGESIKVEAMDAVGIGILELPAYTKIYPNPAQSQLHIELKENQSKEDIMILDQHGRTIINIERVDRLVEQYSIDTSPMSPGVYFVLIGQDRHRVVLID